MLFMIILLGIVILILLDIRSKLPKKRNIVKEEIDKSRQVNQFHNTFSCFNQDYV